MREDEYPRYMRESRKEEWGRDDIILPSPDKASSYLCQACSRKWLWGILANNCVSFVEEILAAGGFRMNYDNCVAFEWVKRSNPTVPTSYVSDRLRRTRQVCMP